MGQGGREVKTQLTAKGNKIRKHAEEKGHE